MAALPHEAGGAGEGRVILEQDQRLSRSHLWTLQRAFFAQQGADAWRKGIVPAYITSNPSIARAYARVVCGFLRDCLPALDTRQRVYLIELGAGSGRFAFHFLKQFLDDTTRAVLPDVQFTYVMTDFSERILEFWRDHPSLQPLVAQGALDFGRFDAAHPRPITLVHAGTTLSPASVTNPIMVLANYVFDSIPQDAFAIRDGQLHESVVTLSAAPPVADRDDPDLLKRLKATFRDRPVTPDAYYGDPDWDCILRTYLDRLPYTSLLFPAVALACLRHFRDLSGDRLLLLSADKGYSREEDLAGHGAPAIIRHGSISLLVNYHAIGAYVQRQGGRALHLGHRHVHLNTAAYLFGQGPDGFAQTAYAFHDAIEQGGPDDFFGLKKAIEPHAGTFTIDQLLAYLRISGWDSRIFLQCLPHLSAHLHTAPPMTRRELRQAIHQVWDTYYPLGEGADLALELGVLLIELRAYEDALPYLHHSARHNGRRPKTCYHIALCHYRMGRLQRALECAEETLALDPSSGSAMALRTAIQARLASP